MTREEAIKVIQEYRDMASGCNLDHDVEGFDMAIESLSAEPTELKQNFELAEPSGDLVRRADAIEAVCNDCEGEHYPRCSQQKYCIEVNGLLALPSAEPSNVDFRTDKSANIGTEVNDLISRAEAKERIRDKFKSLEYRLEINSVLNEVPSAVPPDNDWSEYSDRLWKLAYERGKADRPQGEWLIIDFDLTPFNYEGFYCSNCRHIYDYKMNFCPNCGAEMRGEEDGDL